MRCPLEGSGFMTLCAVGESSESVCGPGARIYGRAIGSMALSLDVLVLPAVPGFPDVPSGAGGPAFIILGWRSCGWFVSWISSLSASVFRAECAAATRSLAGGADYYI